MPILISSNNNNRSKIIPVVPIREGVVFPFTETILTFGRPRSITAVEKALQSNKELIVLMQKDPKLDEPNPEDLYLVGTLTKVERIVRNNGDVNALVKGISRVKVTSFEQLDPYLAIKFEEFPDQLQEGENVEALMKHISSELKKGVNLGKNIDFLSFMNIMSGSNSIDLSYQVASILDIKGEKKQELLEEPSLLSRLEKITHLLAHELKVLEIEKNIASKTQAKFDKSIKEAVLRERMKTIERELGEDVGNKDIQELSKKIKKANMPKATEEKAKKELKRLSQMSNYNPESSYLRTYLDWLVDLPWEIKDLNNVPLLKAEKVLNCEHYGLEKTKERILEYLAVMKLKQKRKDKNGKDYKEEAQPTILCFVGPPGVGKTSIGRSIANALGRKFVKVSLGGIRDEAEIRGHRRTYVGSLPGRIIQSIKQAGTKNPVFMLDEIDKIGTDFRGDPSAALLEALDPEQNSGFTDHYLEVPFDLSKVFFITTCNILDTIPPALKDRLEIIHFPGYTDEEKFMIAKKYLILKQLKAHGLTVEDTEITDNTLKKIIHSYTREAGVRDLERQIAKIYRKIARKKAEDDKNQNKIMVGISDLGEYLGPYKFKPLLAEKEDEVGMSTGLFWTEAGGGILFVEVALMPGKGNLKLTGQLGEVMKESAEAALSYVRSRYKELHLEENFYQSLDIHIHVPEGAVKKDGPSAGIAITTALVSALTNISVHKETGMTGEITLRGRVLEIGGVKEKIIAAHSAGLKKILMPKDNKKDLEDIPKKVLNDLDFVFVEHMDEVLKHALVLPKNKIQEPKRIPLFKPLSKTEN